MNTRKTVILSIEEVRQAVINFFIDTFCEDRERFADSLSTGKVPAFHSWQDVDFVESYGEYGLGEKIAADHDVDFVLLVSKHNHVYEMLWDKTIFSARKTEITEVSNETQMSNEIDIDLHNELQDAKNEAEDAAMLPSKKNRNKYKLLDSNDPAWHYSPPNFSSLD